MLPLPFVKTKKFPKHSHCSSPMYFTKRAESLTLPRTVRISLFQWNQGIRGNKELLPCHSEKLIASQTTVLQLTNYKEPQEYLSQVFSYAPHSTRKIWARIMSLRLKSQYSPNEPSLLPNNNGAPVISFCYSRNRQGMTSTGAKCQIAFNVHLFHISMRARQHDSMLWPETAPNPIQLFKGESYRCPF